MTTLSKRILVEKRALIIPLALGVALNIAAYALWVYPLGVKSVGAAGRAATATQMLKAAERDVAAARALVAGKSRADSELATFYEKVLPVDLSAARRLTYASLPALARRTNVRFLDRRTDPDPIVKGARLGVLKARTQLQCDYESFRQFMYELESAPEFVIIDDVTLTQPDPAKPLTLTLELSTYYLLRPNGN
jgi:hypothetical protein